MKASFPPVISTTTRLLILGSLPGEISLTRGQYYAHPRNQFWTLMGAVTGQTLAGLPYPERLDALLLAGAGLWDVVRAAERVGSLDANIRAHDPNDLGAFAETLPGLRAIAFNGAKAAAIGQKRLGPGYRLPLITLPSSSPAHAVPFDRKLAEWIRLKPYLAGES